MTRIVSCWIALALALVAGPASAEPLDPAYFGSWSPRGAPCGSEPRMVVKDTAVSFRNGTVVETFEGLDACYGCEGSRRRGGVRVTANPPSGQAAPFTLFFTGRDRAVVEFYDASLVSRFPLNGRQMRWCRPVQYPE